MNSVSYKLRIDTDNITPVLDTVLDGILEYSYCSECGPEGQNPHIHLYLRTHLKSDTLRKRIKKLPDYSPGNGFYSLAPLLPDPDLNEGNPYLAYHAYMLKQSDVTYSVKMRGTFFVNVIKEQALDYLSCQKEQQLTKKKKKKTMLQHMMDDIKLTANKEVLSGCPDATCKYVINWYKDNEKLPREFLMISQVQFILLQYSSNYPTILCQNMMKSLYKVEGQTHGPWRYSTERHATHHRPPSEDPKK